MRMRRPQHMSMNLPRQSEIVDVPATAGQKPEILKPANRALAICGLHPSLSPCRRGGRMARRRVPANTATARRSRYVLAPRIGEIIGGSQSEERLQVLDRSTAERGIDREHYALTHPLPRERSRARRG
jgi:hypothetical protein